MVTSILCDDIVTDMGTASTPRWAPVYTGEDLGRVMRALRESRGWTQAELADQLGVSRRYVVEIEQGKPGLFTQRLFAALRLLGGHLRIERDEL